MGIDHPCQKYKPARPIANFVMPYKVMKELWVGSNPRNPATKEKQRAKVPISPLMGPWWTAWICSGLVLSAGAVATRDDTLEATRTFNTLNMVGDATGVVAAVLAIVIVREITSNQDRKHEAISRRLNGQGRPQEP